jgi:glycosyltransferase involved in cell wall biosynthesis
MHPSIIKTFENGILDAAEVAGKTVLEVGAYNVNGTIRPILEQHHPASYLGVDMSPGPGVDRVVDAGELAATFGNGSFEVVVTTEMLEHAADWRRVMGNLVCVVAEGGLLVITTRGPGFPYHGYPDDYWRFTVEVMQAIIVALDFEPLAVYPDPDPQSPGVIAKAKKPAGWELPDESALFAPAVQPERVGSKPLTVLGYPHNSDGSGYYRFYLPYKHLSRGVPHRILLPEPGTKFTPNAGELSQIDVIIGQRIMGPDGIALWDGWKGKVKLVYETDDDILHPDTSGGLAHLYDPNVKATIEHCLRVSDLVTVSTEPLADTVRSYNDNVRVIPNFIHGDMLYLDRKQADRVTIGWAGGMSHLADWMVVTDPLRAVLYDHPDVDMHFCGIDYSPLLRGVECRYTPWQQDCWDYYAGIDFDIGLAPLADTPFNRCKSHIKALEYMALGIPVIASNTPAYADLVVDGVTGWLVNSDDEWSAALRLLVNDEGARKEMGEKGREVARQWTIQQGWKLYRDAYESVTGWTP